MSNIFADKLEAFPEARLLNDSVCHVESLLVTKQQLKRMEVIWSLEMVHCRTSSRSSYKEISSNEQLYTCLMI